MMNSEGLVALIEAMPTEQRKGALAVLDELSRPLAVREIERSLRARGVPMARAVILANAVRGFRIIAMVGGEEHD